MQKKRQLINAEALSQAAHWSRTIGYILAMAAFGLIVSSLGPVLPDLAAQVSVPINVISWVFTAQSGGALVGAFLSGKLFDRVKGHLILVVSLLAQALVLAFIPFVEDAWILFAILFVSGIARGFIVVGASTFIIWEHAENPGPMVSVQGFFTGLGNFISPLIISRIILINGSYSRAFWIYALVYVILSILFFYTPSPAIRASEENESGNQAHENRNKVIYLIALIFLLYTGSEVTYNGWVYTVAITAYPISAAAGRILNALFWGALTVGRIFVGILSRKFTPSQILRVSFIGAVMSFLLSIIIPNVSWVFWMSTIGAGLFMSVIFPTLLLFVEKTMQLSGKMSGTFFMATSIGGMLLPWIAGQAFVFVNPHAVKAVVAVGLFGGYMVFRHINNQHLPN